MIISHGILTRYVAPLTGMPSWSPEILWASFGINLLSLALPLVVLQVYDRIIPYQAYSTLSFLIAGLLTVVAADALLRGARFYLSAWTGARYEHTLGMRAVERLLGADIAAVEAKGAGEFLDAAMSTEAMRDFYASQASLAILDLPFVLIFILVLGFIAGPLILAPVILLLLFAVAASWVGVRLNAALEARSLWDERRHNFVIEVISGIHTVKGLGIERLMQRRYERLVEKSANAGSRVAYLNNMALGLGGLFSQITMVTVLGIGALQAIHGALSIGALAASTLLAGRIVQPVLRALGFWTRFQSIRIADKKVNAILTLPQEAERRGAQSLEHLNRLTMDGVRFSYSPTTPLLKDISLDLRRGEIIGIRGENGCGKTTLLRLMMGNLLAQDGAVALDGVDIRQFTLPSLTAHIAYIPQRPVLFRGTVMENITMYRGDGYLDRAYEIAETLGLDRIFGRLPHGYDTQVGTSARETIPAGVAQRIVIARALISSPSLILFDEATTGLDGEADQRVRELLASYRDRAAVALISFRPSLLAIADRQYEFQDGHLAPRETAAVLSSVKA